MRRIVHAFAIAAVAGSAACNGPLQQQQQPSAKPVSGEEPVALIGQASPGPTAAPVRAPAPTAAARPLRPIAVPPGAVVDVNALDKRRLAEIDDLPFIPTKEPQFCFKPPGVDPATINPDRSLFVHDRATLDALGPDTFSLARTLNKIASDAAAAGATGATGAALFRDLWDTQNPHAGAATPAGAQCDDDSTTLNGFPNACRPTEGAQATAANLAAEIAAYHPIGLVNRLDLAAEGWKNCGEHRIVYGRQGASFERSFIIFEAVLPNPRPGCESGCRAVAQHWYGLSSVADPVERAKRLVKLFYDGLPGYQPVVRVDHYAASASGAYSGGSGQIRTNQFLQQPWMLKEFKLALDCSTKPCKLDPIPIPVKVNPDGHLWTETTQGLASSFQQSVVLPQVDKLAVDDINAFSYQVPLVFDAARSEPQTGGPQDDYFESYTAAPGQPGGFRATLATKAAASSPALTDRQVVNRAVALSCAGCHQPRTFGLDQANSIGPGKTWPASAGFVHVKAEAVAGIHALSPALTTTFLPARAQNLAKLLGDNLCFCRFRKPGIDITELEKAPFGRKPTKIEDLRDAERKLKERVDSELVKRGKPKLPELTPDLKPRTLDLPEVRNAGADPVKQGEARRRAVQDLVGREPPRKTVTGHFRVH